LEGARIDGVTLNRPDLRFPFPAGFARRLEGQTILTAGRRAKYLLFRLSGGATWLAHLGMTGVFRFAEGRFKDRSRYYEPGIDARHDHVVMRLTHPQRGALTLIYSDARRFGFMDLLEGEAASPLLAGLGPEPLGNGFSAETMAARLAGKAAPMKAVLLDQRVVAGLGNIYASEALHRAHIRPTTPAGELVGRAGAGKRLEALATGVRTVLIEAIEAGGSTLRDFRDRKSVVEGERLEPRVRA